MATNAWFCRHCSYDENLHELCYACQGLRSDVERIENTIEDTWACAHCTYTNTLSTVCVVCKAAKPVQVQPRRNERQQAKWACNACTFMNEESKSECEICGTGRHFIRVEAEPLLGRSEPFQGLNFQSHEQQDRKKNTKSKGVNKVHADHVNDAYSLFNKVTTYCSHMNEKFIDDSFVSSDKSLCGDVPEVKKAVVGNRHVVWRRPENMNFSNEDARFEWAVFNGDPSYNDIKQGILGNCWFLSALAVLVEKPEVIRNIIPTDKISPEGCYLVRLCHNGEWKVVILDDLFPCDATSNQLLFAKTNQRRLWVALIEKAFAKLNGTYAALTAGYSIEGLATLTGYPCETVQLTATDYEVKELNWVKLLSSRDAGFAISVACYNQYLKEVDYEKHGLAFNHAYSVLDVKQVFENRLLQIRNPWGNRSWNGKWSNRSAQWTREIRDEFMFMYSRDPVSDEEDTGVFWIAYEDFLQFFNKVDICKIRPNWMEARRSGSFATVDASRELTVFQLKIFETTEVEISLFDKTDTDRHTQLEIDLQLLVFESKPTLPFVTASDRVLRHFTNTEHVLLPNEYMLLPLTFNSWGTSIHHFNLAVHAAKAFTIEEYTVPYHILTDSVLNYAVRVGKRNPFGRNAAIYIVSDRFNGMLVVAENNSENQFLHVQVNTIDSINVVSTRHSLITNDAVPPMHRQVLILLTRLEYSQGFKVNYRYEPKISDRGGISVPPIDDHAVNLHSPRIIF